MLVVHTVDVERDDSNCYPDHALLVVEELDRLGVSIRDYYPPQAD